MALTTFWGIQRLPQSLQHFHREECDLPLVILFVIEKPVAPDAASGHAFDLIGGHDGMFTRRLVVMAEEVVPGRNEKMFDAQHDEPIVSYVAAASGGGSPSMAAAW